MLQYKLETFACIGEVAILAMFLMWHALLITLRGRQQYELCGQ